MEQDGQGHGHRPDLVLPPETGLEPEARYFSFQPGSLTSIIGGNQETTFAGNTHGMVGLMQPSQTLKVAGDGVLYLVNGDGEINGTQIGTGALVRTPGLTYRATSDSYLFVATSNDTANELD